MLTIKIYVNDGQNINNAKSRILSALPNAVSSVTLCDERAESFVLRIYDEKDEGDTVNLEIDANNIMVVEKQPLSED